MQVTQKKWAGVYHNDEFMLVETRSGYRGGLPDPEGVRFLLSPESKNHDLGHAVLEALSASRFLHPGEFPDFFDIRGRVVPQYEAWVSSFMAKYGYKNRRAMFKNMKKIDVESSNGLIVISPSHHEKLEAWSDKGITKDDSVVIAEMSNPEEVGVALEIALSRCS